MCLNENLCFASGLEGNEDLEERRTGAEEMQGKRKGKEGTVSAVRSNSTT